MREHSDLSLRATCVAESRAAAAPDDAKPAPAQHNLAAALAEKRDDQVAETAPHNSRPAEDCFSCEVFPEEGDAFLLDLFEVAQSETGLEKFVVLLLKLGVDIVAGGPLSILLAIVEPLLDRLSTVFSGTRVFEFRMHHRLHPVGIRRTHRTVGANHWVDLGFRDESRLGNFGGIRFYELRRELLELADKGVLAGADQPVDNLGTNLRLFEDVGDDRDQLHEDGDKPSDFFPVQFRFHGTECLLIAMSQDMLRISIVILVSECWTLRHSIQRPMFQAVKCRGEMQVDIKDLTGILYHVNDI